MSRTWMLRLVALALAAALSAPAAWAVPVGGGAAEWWGVVWEWVVGMWEKEGPGMTEDGAPAATTPVPAPDHLDEGPCEDEAG